jgi:Co/Zn/Cd efflux system component
MPIELALFISFIALLFNLISLWAITRMRDDQLQVVKKIWSRLNYVEVGMSYHGMIPMPWEVEEVEDYVRDIKSFKQEGNIVYLPEEGEKNA